MARKVSQPQRQRSRGGNQPGRGKSKAPLFILLGVLLVAGIAVLMWPESKAYFSRQALDEYVEKEYEDAVNKMSGGASIYLDFSDGMNHAYKSDEAKQVLKDVVNKFNGTTIDFSFYTLADGKISPLEGSTTDIYTKIMAPKSYDKPAAPIEKTLATIVERNQPALLITDYEEYKGGKIHNAAYAQKYFINWIKAGHNITFYKWDYSEGAKTKHLYITVFDGQEAALLSMVEQAINLSNDGFVDKFVLGGKDFAFPMMSQYISSTKGGNYHNAEGKDIVSVVKEDGDKESYKCYSTPIAGVNTHDDYSPLVNLFGPICEYYPCQTTWANMIRNSEGFEDFHLLQNMYVDFKTQDGFEISNIEARAFVVMSGTDSAYVQVEPKEVFDVFTATLGQPQKIEGSSNFREITVDFNPLFDGAFKAGVNPTDLFRVNIVVSKAQPKLTNIKSFFGWEGNESLSSSVINTLQSPEVNPEGRVLVSYYLKQIVE